MLFAEKLRGAKNYRATLLQCITSARIILSFHENCNTGPATHVTIVCNFGALQVSDVTAKYQHWLEWTNVTPLHTNVKMGTDT